MEKNERGVKLKQGGIELLDIVNYLKFDFYR